MNDSMMGKKLNEVLKFVYSYLLKMGASKEDAEDIIQDMHINSYNILILSEFLMYKAGCLE